MYSVSPKQGGVGRFGRNLLAEERDTPLRMKEVLYLHGGKGGWGRSEEVVRSSAGATTTKSNMWGERPGVSTSPRGMLLPR